MTAVYDLINLCRSPGGTRMAMPTSMSLASSVTNRTIHCLSVKARMPTPTCGVPTADADGQDPQTDGTT
uniref:Uncharacterized protein n=1 Tax=Arundo donax TaxID=35708 RepID=A0A0A9E0D6_ARUDO